jgi:predicted nucleic acid-binding protein
VVVDASVWVSSLVLGEVHHAASREWLQARAGSGQLVIPTLALAEVAGAIARRTQSGTNGERAAQLVQSTPGIRLVSLDVSLARTAARLAAQHALRGADAVYVAVAALLGLGLVTWDLELQRRGSAVVAVTDPLSQ